MNMERLHKIIYRYIIEVEKKVLVLLGDVN